MRCISLWQPWASLIAVGAKRIETRSWPTAYRGRLAIHAAKRFERDEIELCLYPPFMEALRPFYTTAAELPLGAVVATCTLADCQPTLLDDGTPHPRAPKIDTDEYAFGAYGPERFMWFLTDVHRLPVPVPCRGSQGFFDWRPEGTTPPQPALSLFGEAR